MNYFKQLLLGIILIANSLYADAIIYDNGEDIRANWSVYSGTTGVISTPLDLERGNKVINLNGTDGLGDGFRISDNWYESTKHILSWKMKYSENFTFYVQVSTQNHGVRYVIYKPSDSYSGLSSSGNIRIGLGDSAKDGKWHTFVRDIQKDIQKYNSDYELDNIIKIMVRGSGRLDDIELQSIDVAQKKIFIIGDSTARYDYDDARVGWGDKLGDYMHYPLNVYNRARRGAIAGGLESAHSSYRRNQPISADILTNKGHTDWNTTKSVIESSDGESLGYLFIQFGANDKYSNSDHPAIPENDFKSHLEFYIAEARALNLTPVLVTSPNHRTSYNSRGAYPQYVIDVKNRVENEDVLLLDLHSRSMTKHAEYNSMDEAQSVLGVGTTDKAHYNPSGANISAGWVKELACETDSTLCGLFK